MVVMHVSVCVYESLYLDSYIGNSREWHPVCLIARSRICQLPLLSLTVSNC